MLALPRHFALGEVFGASNGFFTECKCKRTVGPQSVSTRPLELGGHTVRVSCLQELS